MEHEQESRYSNRFKVGFTPHEFVIEFGQAYGPNSELLHTRIVTTPPYAKVLAKLLEGCLEDFEKEHDPIPEIARRTPGNGRLQEGEQ